MTHNPDIERLARVICRAYCKGKKFDGGYTIDDEVENAWHLWVDEAQAARTALLAELSTPSEAMIEAGLRAVIFDLPGRPERDVEAAFTAMIRKAAE